MAKVHSGGEILPKVSSRAHERYRPTDDRQTDNRRICDSIDPNESCSGKKVYKTGTGHSRTGMINGIHDYKTSSLSKCNLAASSVMFFVFVLHNKKLSYRRYNASHADVKTHSLSL